MKLIGSALFLMSLIGICCNNATEANTGSEIISVFLKNNEVYQYKTGIGGDEEGASIIHQANHFEISDIVRNADSMWEAVYIYKPKSGFVGIDYVELKLSSGSDGASRPTDTVIIKIKFNVK